MKNIHVLPTTPNDETAKGIWIKETRDWCNIYITNDEKIKEGDWMLDTIQTCLQPIELATKESIFLLNTPEQGWKKIILTDNTDLIKDGVQAIDDEFLEWFVKNSSCEWVNVEKYFHEVGNTYDYEIIIPKEEPKQETLEEFIKKELDGYDEIDIRTYKTFIYLGAKWQQQQIKNLYSEQNVTEYAYYFESCYAQRPMQKPLTPSEWFNQFKKQ